eukprot:329801-Amphidinium_carterae.1
MAKAIEFSGLLPCFCTRKRVAHLGSAPLFLALFSTFLLRLSLHTAGPHMVSYVLLLQALKAAKEQQSQTVTRCSKAATNDSKYDQLTQ